MNKKQKFEKNRAVYPESKLLFEGDQGHSNFKLSKKDFDTYNSSIEQGFSLHLYKSDFEVFYRKDQHIIEITVEPSREPGYEYIVTRKEVNSWL